MKAEDLRTLDADELTTRLRGARRELYELRFKLAVGQLDDHRQIRKARKDIARILTVVHARRLGEEVGMEPVVETAAVDVGPSPLAVGGAPSGEGVVDPVSAEETPERVEAEVESEEEAEAEEEGE